MTIASNLDAAVRAVCPIDGVSIGSALDKATWVIQFSPSATAAQRTAAQAALAAFDPAVETVADLRADADQAENITARGNAALMALVNSTPAQCITFAQNNFPSLTLAEQNRIGMILNILAISVRPHVR